MILAFGSGDPGCIPGLATLQKPPLMTSHGAGLSLKSVLLANVSAVAITSQNDFIPDAPFYTIQLKNFYVFSVWVFSHLQ